MRTIGSVAVVGLLATALLTMVAVISLAAEAPTPAPASAPATAASQPASGPARTMNLVVGRKNGQPVRMELVLVPAGTFVMGSPEDEEGRLEDERQHEVTISKPFYMGRIEVTWDQFEAVMGYCPNSFWLPKDPPLETGTWEEAAAFCRKLSEATGRTVRLPTEAEWEYACRAGTKTAFHTGRALTTEQANLEGAYDERTSQSGKFPPNAFGLHDMHGNVWEWCQDHYGPYPDGPATDPKGPPEGQTRVMRGGSWFSEEAAECRSARRQWREPDYRYSDVGFRVVVEVE